MHALALAVLVATSAATEKPKLVVLDLTPAGGVEPQVAGALTEALSTEVAARGFFDVLSSKDIATMLGLERQRQMLGCSDDTSCLTELTGALGARFVMNGSVAKLGEAFQLTLQTMDSTKAQPIGRSTRIAPDLAALQAQLPYAVAEATGTPLPPPPSRVLPYALMGTGAAAVIGGGVFGMLALSREAQLNGELEASVPGSFARYEDYERRAQSAAQDKTIALAVAAAGAGLLTAGILLNPSDVPSSGGKQLNVVATGLGAALVGVFP